MIKKKTFFSKLLNSWKKLGPGLVTGASDDDPSEKNYSNQLIDQLL